MWTVLVVEDDPVAADLMSLVLLRTPGLMVHTAENARKAREMLESDQHYSAVITDIHLPGEDGLSLAAAIPHIPGRSNLPVVVVTSSRDNGLRVRAQEAGVRAFLSKPWSAVQLRDTVNSIINGT